MASPSSRTKRTKKSDFEEFWVVLRRKELNKYQQNTITMYYRLESQARAAAEALTKQHNDRFYILKSTAYVEPFSPPLRWSDQ